MYEIKSRRLRSQILTCFIFLVLFSKNGFVKKSNPSEKNVIVEEELDCIDIDDIGNLEDSPRLVFIDEDCGNLIVVNDGGELIEILTKRRSQTFYNSLKICPLSGKCCRREYFFSSHVEYLL